MQYGEIITLGRHRLMCGDATKPEDIEKLIAGENVDLVLTDPPYGMRGKAQHANGCIGSGKRINFPRADHGKKFPSKQYPLMIGDENQETARKHYEIIKDYKHIIMWGGQFFAHFLPVNSGWIFWDKQASATDFSDGELAYKSWGNKLKKYSFIWKGMFRQGSYKLNPRPRVHPTQKPVELHMQILKDFSKQDDVVLDCFGGSGTTLIACELTGHKCLMMELSPEYCDIIKERYEKITQQRRLF